MLVWCSIRLVMFVCRLSDVIIGMFGLIVVCMCLSRVFLLLFVCLVIIVLCRFRYIVL